MENIYHDYWDQELMYQFLTEDKCKKKAYVCSPFSADDKEGMLHVYVLCDEEDEYECESTSCLSADACLR